MTQTLLIVHVISIFMILFFSMNLTSNYWMRVSKNKKIVCFRNLGRRVTHTVKLTHEEIFL